MTDNVKINKPKQIVLLGNYRPAQIAARKAAGLGYQVILGLGGGEGGVEYSKFVTHCWQHSSPQQAPDTFFDELNRLIENYPAIETILPLSEEFTVFLAEHSKQLCRDVKVASPDAEIIETFWDKLRAFDLASRIGVPSLPYALADTYEKFIKQAGEIGFPLIVRPVGITARLGQKKAVIVDDAEALTQLFACWPKGHKQLLIQGLASGIRHNIYFAAHQGVLVGAVESQISRTDHPDGTGLGTDGKTVSLTKSLVEDTVALIKATNYTGIGLSQFIVDHQTGERCFLELNPRISGSHAVPEAAGLALTELAITIANGHFDPTLKQQPTRVGMRYGWTYGDIRGLKTSIAERQISPARAILWALKLIGTALSANVQLSGSLSDPLPELVLYARLIPGVRRLVQFNTSQKFPKILKEKIL